MIIYQQTKPLEYGGFDPKINLTYPNGKLRQTFMDYKEDASMFFILTILETVAKT